MLIEAGAAVDRPDASGATPLHLAASNGAVRAAVALLDAGAAPSPASDDGLTPLHLAAAANHTAVSTTTDPNPKP